MSFRDHFSRRAADYSRFRPAYPEALFAHLASLVPGRQVACDCATGSGQAAVALARHFGQVLATDASPEQLALATADDRVSYAVAYAEQIPVRGGTLDLVTAAAAVHWFDLDSYYAEVRRALRPEGIIAVWSYYTFESEPAIDELIDRYAHEIVGSYWPDRMHLNQSRYETLPFPFHRVDAPRFYAEATWTLEHLLGFASTWSASQRYEARHQRSALAEIAGELEDAWGGPERRVRLRWPLHMLIGRCE